MIFPNQEELQALVCTNLQMNLHGKEQQPVSVQVSEQEHTLQCQLK